MDMVLVPPHMRDQKTIMPLCMINVDRIQQVTIVPENAEDSTSSGRFRVDVRIRLDSDTEKYKDVSFYTGRLANCLEVASYYYAKDWGRLNQIAALGLLELVFDLGLPLRRSAPDYPTLAAIKSEVLSVYETSFSPYTADVDVPEVVSKILKAIDSLEEQIDEWESEERHVNPKFIELHRHAIRLLKIALRFLQ